MKQIPDKSFWQLWNISFGFFGVQIAYALQSANISRIFSTLGADPHNLSYFWLLPPLAGIIVQPFVGAWSDRTWTRWGRRIPYLFIGSLIAVIVMCLLPNAGSFGMAVGTAMIFGLFSLMFLDTSINMAMQPFKMMVGDLVNERQKTRAYSIQSLLVNAGQVVGCVLPWVLANTVFTTEGNGETAGIPQNLTWSFYIGAAILILCVIYTCVNVREMPPKEFAEYHEKPVDGEQSKENMFSLLKKAPAAFWQVGLVQFFCWAGFLFLWNYSTGAIAETVWGTTDAESKLFHEAGDWNGIVQGIESIAAVLWAIAIPRFKNRKQAYVVSILLGAIGFLLIPFISNKYILILPYIMIGCTWAAMLALPFTIVTNALEGNSHMGTYLGLFNGTICIPQIVASICGFGFMWVFEKLGFGSQSTMMYVSAVLLLLGALSVKRIKEK